MLLHSKIDYKIFRTSKNYYKYYLLSKFFQDEYKVAREHTMNCKYEKMERNMLIFAVTCSSCFFQGIFTVSLMLKLCCIGLILYIYCICLRGRGGGWGRGEGVNRSELVGWTVC